LIKGLIKGKTMTEEKTIGFTKEEFLDFMVNILASWEGRRYYDIDKVRKWISLMWDELIEDEKDD